jgi:type I restriction enzyme S subunit
MVACIDKHVGEKERLFHEMESYKKSLIYEYVTGKKEAE